MMGNLANIADVIKSKESDLCSTPPVGGTRLVSMTRQESFTTVTHNYLLRTVGEKHFEVNFYLYFYKKNVKVMTAQAEKLNQKWQHVASECLKKTNGKVFGPNGERIDFKLADQNLIGKQNEEAYWNPSNIEIRKGGQRAHSEGWTEDMVGSNECPTVFHELLHLAGLVDEYEESSHGIVTDVKTGKKYWKQHVQSAHGFDCRKYCGSDSIMNGMVATWNDATADENVIVTPCECIDSKSCRAFSSKIQKEIEAEEREMLESTKSAAAASRIAKMREQRKRQPLPQECPAGYRVVAGSKSEPQPVNREEYQEDQLPYVLDQSRDQAVPQVFTFTPRKNTPSLLEPRHIDAILYPGCLAKNQQYYQNSANAYRTSQAHGGEGCMDLSWPGIK